MMIQKEGFGVESSLDRISSRHRGSSTLHFDLRVRRVRIGRGKGGG